MFEITFKGQERVERELMRLSRASKVAAGQALREEAEIEMTEAKQRTPVRTGALRASGHVEGPFATGDVEVLLIFGNAAVDYAAYVHENLEAHHAVGQAKFLESVLTESAPYFAARVARRIAQILGTA
jgi:Bacteriophage HK97-gp10, putative tail-component